MIWLVRAGFGLAILILVTLALTTSQAQPGPPIAGQSAAADGAASAAVAPTPEVAATPTPIPAPRPTATPETIISRVARVTATPLPRLPRTGTSPADISIDDDGFAPALIQVKVGQPVVWRNDSLLSHDVTPLRPGPWGTGPILPNASVTEVFQTPGQYDYLCSLHSAMRGRVIVTP